MAGLHRQLGDVFSPDKGHVMVAFSFKPNGGNAPSSSTFKGDLLSSVANTATGVWTCTLTDGAYDIIALSPGVQLASAADVTVHAGAVDLTNKTVVVRAYAGGSASTLTTDDRIHVVLHLKKTQVTTRRT